MLENLYPVNPEAHEDKNTPLIYNVNGVNVHLHGDTVKNPVHADGNERQHLTYTGHALRSIFKALQRMPPRMTEDFKNHNIHFHGPDSNIFSPQIPFVNLDTHEDNPHLSHLNFFPINDDNNYHIFVASNPTLNPSSYPITESPWYGTNLIGTPRHRYTNEGIANADMRARSALSDALIRHLFNKGIVRDDITLLGSALQQGLREPDSIDPRPLRNAFNNMIMRNPYIKNDLYNLYKRWLPETEGSEV